MAKQNPAKQRIPIPPELKNQVILAINSKKEKPKGEMYALTAPFKYYGQKELPEQTIFTECNDGFFNIMLPDGETIEHYRIRVEMIPSDIIFKLKTIHNARQNSQ